MYSDFSIEALWEVLFDMWWIKADWGSSSKYFFLLKIFVFSSFFNFFEFFELKSLEVDFLIFCFLNFKDKKLEKKN